MLSNKDDGWMKDYAMIAAGGFIGSLPAALSFVAGLATSGGRIAGTYSDLASFVIVLICAVVGCLMGRKAVESSKKVSSLQTEIRARGTTPG